MNRSRVSAPRDSRPLGPLDPRDHAWRHDLADIALADKIAVPAYAVPAIMRVLPSSVALTTGHDPASAAASELLHGEEFAVLDSFDGIAWGYGLHDFYVGHVPLVALAPAENAAGDAAGDASPYAMVGPHDALLLARPSVKAPVVGTLPMAARLAVADAGEQFCTVRAGPHAGAFVHRRHLLPAGGDAALDWVLVAERFQGAPYRWGGRTRAGIDCSGLIQVARMVAGRPTRRDSDMQAADAGPAVASAAVERGDIACWPGHIGVMLDAGHLLHANAHAMACVAEPLADVVARAAARGDRPTPIFHRPT